MPPDPRLRPDPAINDAIVRAAVTLFLEVGLQRMTVPGVAAAAGRTTGSARTDLIMTLAAVRERIDPTVTATVLVEAQEHPEILDLAP